jgi:hypothetical protein
MRGSYHEVRPLGKAPNGRRGKVHPHAAHALGLESQASAGDRTGGPIRELNDLSFSTQRTHHGAEDLELVGLPEIAEGKAGNNGIYRPYARPGKDVGRMRCLAATDSNSRKMRLEEVGQNRIPLDDEKAFWPEPPPEKSPGDRARPRTDFEHRRLGGIYS